MTLPFLYQTDDRTDGSFAAPDESKSFSERLATAMRGPAGIYETVAPILPHNVAIRTLENRQAIGELFSAAERQTRTVEAFSAREQAMAEVYERRIKAVRDLTGVTLENPEMGGYRLSERELRRLTADGPIDPAVYRRDRFEEQLGALREKHPDQIEALTFGDIGEEAKAVAAGADANLQRVAGATPLSGPESLAVQFAGGLWGMRRDPLFQGSLFFGPTTAVGRTALARVGSAAVRQGLFNMGLSAAEQPTVQAWRAEVGLKHGIVPAMENIGLAFLFGAIPGAAFRGVHEARVKGAVERVLAGAPEKGDMDVALRAVGADLAPHEARALRLGEEMAEADRVTQPPPVKQQTDASGVPVGLTRDEYDAWRVREMNRLNPQLPEELRLEHGVSAAPTFDGDIGTKVGESRAYVVARVANAPSGTTTHELRHVMDKLFTGEGAGVTRAIEALSDDERAVLVAYLKQAQLDGKIDKGSRFTDASEIAQAAIDARMRDARGLEAVNFGLHEFLNPLAKRYGHLNRTYDEYAAAGGASRTHVSPQLADDLHTAALRAADDPIGNPSPEAVALVRSASDEVPLPPEVADRIAAARPENEREAAMAASEALEDIGNRQTMARVTEERVATRLPPPPEPFAPPVAGSKDPLDRIPMADDEGKLTMVTARQAARAGERETKLADVIRECKA